MNPATAYTEDEISSTRVLIKLRLSGGLHTNCTSFSLKLLSSVEPHLRWPRDVQMVNLGPIPGWGNRFFFKASSTLLSRGLCSPFPESKAVGT